MASTLCCPARTKKPRIATYRKRAERTFHMYLKEVQGPPNRHHLDEPMLKNEAKSEMKNEPKLLEFAFKTVAYVRPNPIGRSESYPCHTGRNYKNYYCGTNPIPPSQRFRGRARPAARFSKSRHGGYAEPVEDHKDASVTVPNTHKEGDATRNGVLLKLPNSAII